MAYDINVDKNALPQAASKIRNKIEDLSQAATRMNRNILKASRDFTSVNFARASECIGGMQDKLTRAREDLDKLINYLNELKACAEKYLNSKWRG